MPSQGMKLTTTLSSTVLLKASSSGFKSSGMLCQAGWTYCLDHVGCPRI